MACYMQLGSEKLHHSDWWKRSGLELMTGVLACAWPQLFASLFAFACSRLIADLMN